METKNSNQRLQNLRRLQLARERAEKLNRLKNQNGSGQFSSRRGSLPPDSLNRRRNQFRNPNEVRRYNNLVQRNANPLQKAILKRQQMRRQQELRSRQKMNRPKMSSPRMKLGASSVSRNGDQYPSRYNRRLNQREREQYEAPSYDSPPNIMQDHYDREYSNFNSKSSKPKSFLTTVPMIRVPSLMFIHCRSKSLTMLILKWWLISTEILRKVANFIWSFCNI